jgi:hypothetical protein
MGFLTDCTPAMVHLILSIFVIIGSFFAGLPFFQILKSIITSAVWLFLLSWLCNKGFTWLSWFLVLFPFVIIIGALIVMMLAVGKMQTAQTAQTDQKKNAQPPPQNAQTTPKK